MTSLAKILCISGVPLGPTLFMPFPMFARGGRQARAAASGGGDHSHMSATRDVQISTERGNSHGTVYSGGGGGGAASTPDGRYTRNGGVR